MLEMPRQQETALNSRAGQPSPLIRYTLRGLGNCWMPEHGRWSHIYHLDGRAEPNQSVPESDVFYTLNVLLGFSRIPHLAESHGFDLPKIFWTNVSLVPKLNSQRYAYGMALWAAAELGLDIPAETLRLITSLVEDRKQWEKFRAQDLGMVLIGCVEQARRKRSGPWALLAPKLFSFLNQRYSCSSGLFFDAARTGRRSFSSFATNTYLTLACYVYGEWSSDEGALRLAKACTRKLIELQGPQGEWPWFFFTPGGCVVDFYEVYSVHQIGMAPAFLACAERHNVPGAKEALAKGSQWVFGHNQMNLSMLRKREGLICRSQVRKGELNLKTKRIFRAMTNALTRRSAKLIDPSQLELRLECRSYELGWILWSFGARNDLAEIQCHSDLS
ncbi:MAG TPA: hypothetical protein VNB49_08655 [Candidatus Dormibacteraeota bacterium]|nr:hypothetical protein [Candidatus Dormibacteraeota bacterium]